MKIRKKIFVWRDAVKGRDVSAYIGTDHALTSPEALMAMLRDGIDVRIMRHYKGTFHPKVMHFEGKKISTVLAGSNNLTADALVNNIEFATVTEFVGIDQNFLRWHDEIHEASEPASMSLVKSYATEKRRYGEKLAASGQGGTFTWSQRTSGKPAVSKGKSTGKLLLSAGNKTLVLEVMPRETSEEGRQIQIPLSVASKFFGLGSVPGSFQKISLRNSATKEARTLLLTLNANSTARLSIRELEYKSRPCLLVFMKTAGRNKYDFELIRRAIDPTRFIDLLATCPQKSPARRWHL